MTAPRSALRSYVRVRFGECDPLGHVNNTVYLGYLEQVAIDHAAAVGWPASRLQAEFGAVFVARKHEIEFLAPAFENDVLEILTWPETMSGARAFRRYQVRRADVDPFALPVTQLLVGDQIVFAERRDLLVAARTEWALADVERGRPVRIATALANDFLMEDA